MNHKYLQDIMETELVFFPNWFRRHTLEEYLEIDISVKDWNNFIDWWDNNGDGYDLRKDMSVFWGLFNENYKDDYREEEVE